MERKPQVLESGKVGTARSLQAISVKAISVKNVLYATDFSPAAESALSYATAICRRFGSTLHVGHVISSLNALLMTGAVDYVNVGTAYDDACAQAREKLQRIKNCSGKIPCETHIRNGQVWPSLNEMVAENQVDLMVVGTHGRTGLGMLLLGSVAEEILRHASCPVLMVGPEVCGRAKLPETSGDGRDLALADLELQQILYAANFTPESRRSASVFISLAQEFRARTTLLHVFENYVNPLDRLGRSEGGVEQLQAFVPKDANLAYAPEIVTEFGLPWQCIVDQAEKRCADLIVLGAHPAGGTSHRPWSTVHQVVSHATCPVLTVPA